MALSINGGMKVKTLRADFLEEFGLTLRVYDGRSFADDHATLASIRKGDSKGGEFSPKRNTKVGNLEDKIMELFNIKTQVAGSDDSYLCENDHTLAKALEVDEKLMEKRKKRGDKPATVSSQEEDVVSNKNAQNVTDAGNNMSLEDIIAKIKIVYKDHEDLEEIVDDLEGDSYFDHWAEKFITEDYGNNVELAKVLFKIAEKKADNFDDFSELANKIGDEDKLGDKGWARALFKKALEYEEDRISDLTNIAENIANENVLGDKEWARKIIKKALKKADGNNLENIASSIIFMFEDKEWAKEVYVEAINKADDAKKLSWIGNAIAENWDDEKELCKKAYNKGLEKAEEDSYQFYMKFYIANGILENIDRERGIEIGLSVIDDDRCNEDTCVEVARSIARGDVPEFQEKVATVYKKIIAGDSSDSIVQLLESYINPEEDLELFRQAGERVEELCRDTSAYCMADLGAALSNARETDWAKRVYETAMEIAEEDQELVYIWDKTYVDNEEWVEKFKENLIERCEEDETKEEISGE